MTKPTRTLRALERAAMRWFNRRGFFFTDDYKVEYPKDAIALENACARHAAAARKRKSTKEKS